MKKCSPFWVSFFHTRTGIEEGGAAGGSVKNMPATCFLARGRFCDFEAEM
jgi:hypothetical protein